MLSLPENRQLTTLENEAMEVLEHLGSLEEALEKRDTVIHILASLYPIASEARPSRDDQKRIDIIIKIIFCIEEEIIDMTLKMLSRDRHPNQQLIYKVTTHLNHYFQFSLAILMHLPGENPKLLFERYISSLNESSRISCLANTINHNDTKIQSYLLLLTINKTRINLNIAKIEIAYTQHLIIISKLINKATPASKFEKVKPVLEDFKFLCDLEIFKLLPLDVQANNAKLTFSIIHLLTHKHMYPFKKIYRARLIHYLAEHDCPELKLIASIEQSRYTIKNNFFAPEHLGKNNEGVIKIKRKPIDIATSSSSSDSTIKNNDLDINSPPTKRQRHTY